MKSGYQSQKMRELILDKKTFSWNIAIKIVW